jgi:hypothetical protein
VSGVAAAGLAGAAQVVALDESKVTPGLTGFLVVAALGVALWLLLRSFLRQLRRIDFEEGREPGPAARTARREAGERPQGPPPAGRPSR